MNTDKLDHGVSYFEALHDPNLDGVDALVVALQEAAAHIRDLRERVAALETANAAGSDEQRAARLLDWLEREGAS